MWACGLDWSGPGQGQVAYACECSDEPSGSVKCGEFLDQLQASQLLRKDSAPCSEYYYYYYYYYYYMTTAGSSEMPVNQVTWFHSPKSSVFKFSKVKRTQRNTNDPYINFVRAMYIFDSSPYDNNKQRRCLATDKRDCLEIPMETVENA